MFFSAIERSLGAALRRLVFAKRTDASDVRREPELVDGEGEKGRQSRTSCESRGVGADFQGRKWAAAGRFTPSHRGLILGLECCNPGLWRTSGFSDLNGLPRPFVTHR